MEKRRSGKRTLSFEFCLSAEELQDLNEICKKMGLNKSDLIRQRIFNPNMLQLNHSGLLTELNEIGKEMSKLGEFIVSCKNSEHLSAKDADAIKSFLDIYSGQLQKLQIIINKLLYRVRNRS